MGFELGPRRGRHLDITEHLQTSGKPLSDEEVAHFERFDRIYRSLCALLYNYAPMSGHPGGSISVGRIVSAALFETMAYDVSDPDRADADIISYAAGHKAMGLYAMWALRNEIVRLGAHDLLPESPRLQLRLEDLIGFRRNPVTRTPRFLELRSRALDGHPTPATPFVRLATGASGVGLASSLGLAVGARDFYGNNAPWIHIIEGEGGLTPGRVAEALAAAGTASLRNAVLHVDWNQASIDSDRVCRDGEQPGDYVQWTPVELAYLHDWNVIYVPDGTDYQQIVAAQACAMTMDNDQPTAVVYKTVKGWQYGIEGRASHGAGHQLCSDGFFEALQPLLETYQEKLPSCCDLAEKRCSAADGADVMEECFWEALLVVRRVLERESEMVTALAERVRDSRLRLLRESRKPREGAPKVESVYDLASRNVDRVPQELRVEPGTRTTLRGELGRALSFYNEASGGALLVAAADLLGSTSVLTVADGFPGGYYHATSNPEARLLSSGGICEDAMAGMLSGISSYGRHIGIGSSYGAFLAALGHIPARLHAIGSQARQAMSGDAFRPMMLVCAHAGLKTGEDGPTHADPQALQLVQENFPMGTAVTLTPWEPQEVWTLLTTALAQRPAVILPFVTRPAEGVPDREKLGLAPATEAAKGLYLLRAAEGAGDGTVVLQGSGVTLAFIEETLPRLIEKGTDLNVYYVASAELFDALPRAEQTSIFPAEKTERAMGITGFTLPTIYRWVRSAEGRAATLHPFRKGMFLGSGPGPKVLEEAGLDGESQYKAILAYIDQSVRV